MQTLLSESKCFRNRPPVGFDSILTGERDVDHIGIYSHQRHNELQYLVFDSKQVIKNNTLKEESPSDECGYH